MFQGMFCREMDEKAEEEAKDEGSFEPTIIRTETGDANHKTMQFVTKLYI